MDRIAQQVKAGLNLSSLQLAHKLDVAQKAEGQLKASQKLQQDEHIRAMDKAKADMDVMRKRLAAEARSVSPP